MRTESTIYSNYLEIFWWQWVVRSWSWWIGRWSIHWYFTLSPLSLCTCFSDQVLLLMGHVLLLQICLNTCLFLYFINFNARNRAPGTCRGVKQKQSDRCHPKNALITKQQSDVLRNWVLARGGGLCWALACWSTLPLAEHRRRAAL